MARSGSTRSEIGVADSLRPMALESARAKREAPTVRDARRRSRAWSVLWFFGAAVFSFSAMAVLERRGLSQILMPPRPPPAEVFASKEGSNALATRQTRTFEDALTSPWRHRDRGESEAPATNGSTATHTTTSAAPKKEAKPATARGTGQPVATGAKPAASGHDEVAAAAAILEKARGEHSLE